MHPHKHCTDTEIKSILADDTRNHFTSFLPMASIGVALQCSSDSKQQQPLVSRPLDKTAPKMMIDTIIYDAQDIVATAAALWAQVAGACTLILVEQKDNWSLEGRVDQLKRRCVLVLGSYSSALVSTVMSMAHCIHVVMMSAADVHRLAGLCEPEPLVKTPLVAVWRLWPNVPERLHNTFDICGVIHNRELGHVDDALEAVVRAIKSNDKGGATLMERLVVASTEPVKNLVLRGAAEKALERSVISNWYSDSFVTHLHCYRARVCHANPFVLATAHYVLQRDREIDLAMVYGIEQHNRMRFTLVPRDKGRCNVSEIAAKHGGGATEDDSAAFGVSLIEGATLLTELQTHSTATRIMQ